MPFRKAVVDFHALHGRRLCTLPHLLGRKIPRGTHECISAREAGISLGVGGIFFDGLTEEIDRLLKSILSPLVPIEKTLEIKLVGFGVLSVMFGELFRLCPREFRPQAVVNLLGDVPLYGEQVRYFAGELISPQLRSV